jgi:hypothetical protein
MSAPFVREPPHASGHRSGRTAGSESADRCAPLLIIDELGYLPLDQAAANWIFHVVSKRYERGSIIITSNRGFADWAQIFNDVVVATPLSTARFTTPPSSTSAARAIGCVRIKSCRRAGMADRDEPVIEIGRLGKIVSGDDAGDYILVQDQLTETGGYLILLGHDPALTSGGGDYWVERHQLEKAFKQKRWTVDWNLEGGGATVP